MTRDVVTPLVVPPRFGPVNITELPSTRPRGELSGSFAFERSFPKESVVVPAFAVEGASCHGGPKQLQGVDRLRVGASGPGALE